MSIILVGLNHRTAPLELREKLALSDFALQTAFADLRTQTAASADRKPPSALISEAVVLSTCNRLEIYAIAEHPADGAAFIEHFLSALQNIPVAELKAHLYNHSGDTAITYLMRVACGLDSMILGETQILGQVTQAFENARDAGVTGAVLSHLFANVIHTGKRARTETPISRYTTSISHAGALLMMEKLGQRAASVLILGAGEMAVLAAQALKRFDVRKVFINRTYERAEALADEFGGAALSWLQLDEALVKVDAVICATGAPHTVIYRHDVEAALPQREGRPLVIMDIAVPRDVEATVRALPEVQYFDVDDLKSVVDGNVELRRAAVPQVESIIQQEMSRFAEWYRGRQVTPVIKNLREWGQSIADDELAQTLNRLSDADERTRQIVSHMAHRLVNRLLHEPTSRLRLQANEGNGYGYAHAVRELFALNADDVELVELDTHQCQCDGAQGSILNAEQPVHACNLQCIMP